MRLELYISTHIEGRFSLLVLREGGCELLLRPELSVSTLNLDAFSATWVIKSDKNVNWISPGNCSLIIRLLTSTSVAVSESPLSLPSGRSWSSAAMHMGSSTLVLEADFCEGILFLDRTLMPLWERGIWGELPPPSDEYSVSAMLLRDLVWLSFNFL